MGFLRGFIGRIKGVRILKFDGWLKIWLKKSKTNDKTKTKLHDFRAKIDQIRGKNEENWKFNGQLRIQVHIS